MAASKPPLRYPLATLEQESDYLFLEILEYKRQGKLINQQIQTKIVNEGTQASKVVENIILPIPTNLVDANGISWGDSSLNQFQATALEGLSGAMENMSLTGGAGEVMKTLQSLISDGAGAQEDGNMITSSIAASIVNSFGGQVTLSDVLARRNGVVLNPNMELLFKGPNLRTFNFNFQMSPRSGKEALAIKNIIRVLKKNMSAKKTGSGDNGIFLQTPNIFQLSFRQGASNHPFLFNMKPMSLTNMSVNYTGTGTYATYAAGEGIPAGTPVQTNMSLSFSELAPIYNEDYDNTVGGVGY